MTLYEATLRSVLRLDVQRARWRLRERPDATLALVVVTCARLLEADFSLICLALAATELRRELSPHEAPWYTPTPP